MVVGLVVCHWCLVQDMEGKDKPLGLGSMFSHKKDIQAALLLHGGPLCHVAPDSQTNNKERVKYVCKRAPNCGVSLGSFFFCCFAN